MDGLDDEAAELVGRLGHKLADPALLRQAFAHRSWCGEQDDAPSNERLEFLGDAVLGLVVAEHCFVTYPGAPEGTLAKVRAAVVNTTVVAEVADELDLGRFLLLGKGEEATGGRSKRSILADTLEAVIGAVYVDAGLEPARAVVLGLFGDRIKRAAAEPDGFDYKSRLQELTVRRGLGVPHYVVEGTGPDHDRRFLAELVVGGSSVGHGEGPSKKRAEQAAALAAWRRLYEMDEKVTDA